MSEVWGCGGSAPTQGWNPCTPSLNRLKKAVRDKSIYFRYFHRVKLSTQIAHERLTRICLIECDRALILLADHKNSQTGKPKILNQNRAMQRVCEKLGLALYTTAEPAILRAEIPLESRSP